LPGVGTHTASAYGAEDEPVAPVVCLSDEGDLRGVRSALRAHIADKLGVSMREVSDADLMRHGLIVEVAPDDDVWQLQEDGTLLGTNGEVRYADRPISIEP